MTDSPIAGRVASDGMGIAYLDWGGTGPPLLLLHPNGFCAGVYDPLARGLVGRCRVVGVDLRGHGSSDDITDSGLLGNDAIAMDVLAVADHLGMDRFAILGVSFGGAVGIEVAVAAPERVGALVLCEAIAIEAGAREEHPLAIGARRRRDVWDDREAVLASYGSRPPMDALDPEALAGYVRWGFRNTDDGVVELACRPETEALIFGSERSHGPVEAFEALHRVTSPAAVMAGTHTDLDPSWFVAQAGALGVDLQLVEGGHFCLFEDTDRAVRLVGGNLRALGYLQ